MEGNNLQETQLCSSCAENSINTNKEIVLKSDNNENIEKCKQWLMEKCTLNDRQSEFSSSLSTSGQSDSDVFSEFEFDSTINSLSTSCDKNSYGDVTISNSEHVIIGNVTYVTGPVNITQNSSNFVQQNISNQIFLDGSATTWRTEKLRIISRLNWLAQPAFQKIPLNIPVKYVIIAHTATEEGFTQAENTLLVRLTQTFHVESCKFDDISYNFLIGSDGNVYQGRGWNIQGEHTTGYNQNSIAIAFVGYFNKHLPPPSAIKAAKTLIQHGVDLGFISGDYFLVGQRQFLPIENPGLELFNEVKNWPNWTNINTISK